MASWVGHIMNWVNIAIIVGGFSTFVLLILAVISAWFIREQISVMREEGNITRTLEFMDRYSEPNYQTELGKVIKFLHSFENDKQSGWQVYLKEHIGNSCFKVFSLFEYMGALYNRNLLIKSLIKSGYSGLFVYYFSKSEWLIEKMREEGNKYALCEWETMIKDMKKGEK